MKTVEKTGYQFGTFKGVFTPSILTILGVIMYLRSGWVLGHVGLPLTLVIVTVSSAITFLTGLSVSALATNMRVRGGGAYYIISRSLGIEVGAAVGIPFFFAQAISIAFYVAGFSESVVDVWPVLNARAVGLVTLVVLGVLTTFSADLALKAQFVVMGVIGLSLGSLFLGGSPETLSVPAPDTVPAPLGFWPVLAVFFPAVTGILAGVGMSGDLKNPARSLPYGTLAAVLTGYVIYLAIPVFLYHCGIPRETLLTDTAIALKVARWRSLLLLGIWAASLSSAVGCLLAAPRLLQALSADGVVPRMFGRGFGAGNDPRLATGLAFVIGGGGLLLGDINLIAPVLTMFYLTAYGLINLSAGFEELMGNPSWRPTFRVSAVFSFTAFAACFMMMFMISAGSTFVAAALVAAVYWLMKNRAMRARWGDMRYGILMFLARTVMRRLARQAGGERNWRPNLLVLTGAPNRRTHLLDLADAISGNRSLVSVGVVIPERNWSAERAARLNALIQRHLDERGTDAYVVIHPSDDPWVGIREVVRAYGFGPLTPNTILAGVSYKPFAALTFAHLIALVAKSGRNLVLVRERALGLAAPSIPKRIDIWCRGITDNAAFMLALACLIRRSPGWDSTRLRFCHLVESEERREDVQRSLGQFLSRARIDADLDIRLLDDRPLFVMITEMSRDASLVCFGVRKPEADADIGGYAFYYRTLLDNTAGLPLTLFAMAAEAVDFQRIFRT